jgi:hypothetical protein
MQNNKDAGQQDDDSLAMTAVEDAGERARLSIVLDVKAPTGEYNITGAEAMGQERFRQAEIGRGRSPSICWYWERTGTCQRGTAASGLTLILPATISPRTQGPAAKKPRGKMVKNTEILGEFRRTLSRFSAAN